MRRLILSKHRSALFRKFEPRYLGPYRNPFWVYASWFSSGAFGFNCPNRSDKQEKHTRPEAQQHHRNPGGNSPKRAERRATIIAPPDDDMAGHGNKQFKDAPAQHPAGGAPPASESGSSDWAKRLKMNPHTSQQRPMMMKMVVQTPPCGGVHRSRLVGHMGVPKSQSVNEKRLERAVR